MGLGLSAGDVRPSITLVDSITSEGPGARSSTTCPRSSGLPCMAGEFAFFF